MTRIILSTVLLFTTVCFAADTKPSPKGKEGKKVFAVFNTSMGTFKAQLFPDKAPKTVENFVGLATGKKEWKNPKTGKMEKDKSLFAGTIFHRIIAGFMIQGGDPAGNGTGGPGYEFANENSDLKHDKPGILAMANAGRDTNGSQFYVTVSPQSHLDGGYTIFGQVVEGMPVVQKISEVKTVSEKPVTDVVLKSVTIQEK